MAEQLLSSEPLPGNGVRLILCASIANHTPPQNPDEPSCPFDQTYDWGRLTPSESDAVFVARIRKETKLLAAEKALRVSPPALDLSKVPTTIRGLVGRSL